VSENAKLWLACLQLGLLAKGRFGSVRDSKPCQRWRQLSSKAAMAAPCLPGTSFAAQTAAEPGQLSDGSRRGILPRHEQPTPIPGRAADDPRQHARQRRAVARDVVLAVPRPMASEPWNSMRVDR
jgi:hypothetical protein